MDIKALEQLTDDQLTEIAGWCAEIKQRRKEEGDTKAMDEAIALLAARGLDVSVLMRKKAAKAKVKKESPYKSGHIYQHPENASLTWIGHGPLPKWVKDLEAKGGKPLDKGIRPNLLDVRKVG